MAIIKHIASKNADYTAAERYLVFQHDERTQKMILDGDGYPMVREEYLLEGIGCDPYNFAAECRKENRKYGKNKDQREIKTHHYIISFDPEDRETSGLTMERAQKLGMAFAREHFPGHQMLVCTHDDGHNGSGNIHVHIVLNSLRVKDTESLPYHMRPCDTRTGFKHNCSRDFMKFLKDDLMKLCKEQGFNQVDLNCSARRVSDKEYHAKKRGQEKLNQENAAKIARGETPKQTVFQTELEKIRQAICETVLKSQSTEEFIRILQDEYEIQVKESRGRWSYLPSGRKQPVTHRRLGDAFAKSSIETAIREHKALIPEPSPEKKVRKEKHTFVHSEQKWNSGDPEEKRKEPRRKISGLSELEEIGKVIAIEKAGSSEAYAQWIKVHNLQELAKTFRFMAENDFLDSARLDAAYASLTELFRDSRKSMKETESQIKEQNYLIRLLAQHYKGRDTYRDYRRTKNKKQFKQDHQAELDLYKSASKELKEMFGEGKLPSMQKLKKEKAALQERKKEQYTAYQEIRKEWLEIGKLIQNRDSFLSSQMKAQSKNRQDTDLE